MVDLNFINRFCKIWITSRLKFSTFKILLGFILKFILKYIAEKFITKSRLYSCQNFLTFKSLTAMCEFLERKRELALSFYQRGRLQRGHAAKKRPCGVRFSEHFIGSHCLNFTFYVWKESSRRQGGRSSDSLAGGPLADGVVNTLKKQYFASKECKHWRPLNYYDIGWNGGKFCYFYQYN